MTLVTVKGGYSFDAERVICLQPEGNTTRIVLQSRSEKAIEFTVPALVDEVSEAIREATKG